MRYFNFTSHLCLLIIIIISTKINIVFASDFVEQKNTDQAKIIKNIKSYIEKIKIMAIDFEQIDSHGSKAKGILIIDKPYKFRINYFKPFPLLIVGNKNYVSVYDYEMKNLSRIGEEENVFRFLLLEEVDFAKRFEIISAKEDNNYASLKMNHHNSGRIITIKFDKKTQIIDRMDITEENNNTIIKFGQMKKLKKANENLFILQDPQIFGEPKYLDKAALEKIFKH